MYGGESDEEETTSEVAAIAITSSTSSYLFESPNENVPIQSAKCLMVKATEVSPSSTSKTMNEMDDLISLRIKEENVALDRFMTNLQGEAKKRFEALMSAADRNPLGVTQITAGASPNSPGVIFTAGAFQYSGGN